MQEANVKNASDWDKGVAIVGAMCAMVVGTLWYVYGKVLPFPNGDLGHDYSLFVPNLVVGFIKLKVNGFFSVPWFSPAQCGGFPFFPDANAPYYSLTQFLTLIVDPVVALQITFIVFGGIGFLGAYLLLRNGLERSRPASLLGAFIFGLNGFYAHRFVNGHLAFHAFALAPLAAWTVFYGLKKGWREHIIGTCLLGLVLAVMFHAGMVHGIPPVVAGIAVLILVYGILDHWSWSPWWRLTVGGMLGICLSAAKILPLMSLLKQFPRDQYALPGFDSIPNAVWLTAQTLFLYPPMAEIHKHMANGSILLLDHEFQYGIGMIPALLLLIFVTRQAWKPNDSHLDKRVIAAVWGIGLLLTIPLLLNFYTPWWNGVLKSLPYFKNSSSLVRWFALYVFVLPMLAAIVLDFFELPGRRILFFCGFGIMVTWAQALNTDLDYMTKTLGHYPSGGQVDFWRRIKFGEEVPNINFMTLTFDIRTLEPIFPIDRNDAMVKNSSQIMCYQSMMGYALESFPVAPLTPKSAMSEVGEGLLNIKRPECYLYPEENRCKPGDHFTVEDDRVAKSFLFYKDYEFERPGSHDVAVAVNGVSLVLTFAALGIALARPARSREDDAFTS